MRLRARKLTTQRLTWLSGLALILVGILCLSLSGAVASTGTWWQGTLDAFGVGLVVGGIVDVLVISLMGQFSSARQRRFNDIAEALLRDYARVGRGDHTALDRGSAARLANLVLLTATADTIDPGLRRELEELVDKGGSSSS